MGLRLSLYRKRQSLGRSVNRALNGSCTVLLYHRIHSTDYDPQRLSVDPGNFRSHLIWLKKHFRVLSVDEFDRCLEKGRFPGKSALITFDDGYADNLHQALPILQLAGLQALFYIATRNIGTRELFWWDELDLLFRGDIDVSYLNVLMNGKSLPDRRSVYEVYLRMLKRASSLEARDVLLAKIRPLRPLTEAEKSPYRCLDLEELKRFSASSHAVVGAHTVNHLSLGALVRDSQFNEMNQSVLFLEDHLKRKIIHFSYPYGEAQDFNFETLAISSRMGLRNAAANFSGIVSRGANVFAFPRVVVRNGDINALKASIRAAR